MRRIRKLKGFAQAYLLGGGESNLAEIYAQLESWEAANPFQRGINWASALEVAFRALSWTWALEFFCHGAERDDSPWLIDLLVGLDRQLSHIAVNLSRYFSPNTHLTGEALALYAVSTSLPELRRSPRRAALGRRILLREAASQVHEDGGHAERVSKAGVVRLPRGRRWRLLPCRIELGPELG